VLIPQPAEDGGEPQAQGQGLLCGPAYGMRVARSYQSHTLAVLLAVLLQVLLEQGEGCSRRGVRDSTHASGMKSSDEVGIFRNGEASRMVWVLGPDGSVVDDVQERHCRCIARVARVAGDVPWCGVWRGPDMPCPLCPSQG
jgi:hypothetical protein